MDPRSLPRQLASIACAFALAGALVPLEGASALAASENAPQFPDESPAVALPEGVLQPLEAAEEHEGNVWRVSGCSSLERALDEISHAPGTVAIIELTADANNATKLDSAGCPFVGVPGKRITVRSAPAADGSPQWHSIFVGVDIVGDVIFDNVHAFGKIVFANGHHFETTENCRAGAPGIDDNQCFFGMVYGGGHHAVEAGQGDGTVASTDLVLGGNVHFTYVFGGGYRSEVTGDTHVAVKGSKVSIGLLHGGGMAREVDLSGDGTGLPDGAKADAAQGRVHGDAHVDLEGAVECERVFGGGCESNVGGNTHVTIDGNVKVQELFGGGMAQDSDGGKVDGGTNVVVRQGELRSVVAGGANWGAGNRENARVAGTARSVFGFAGAPAGSVRLGADYCYGGDASARYGAGGSVNSTVGNVSLSLLEGVRVQSDAGLFACGASDTVRGTVDVRVKDAVILGDLYGGGLSRESASDKAVRILNEGGSESALAISYGVRDDLLREEAFRAVYVRSFNDTSLKVAGDVRIEFEDGSLDMLDLGHSVEGDEGRDTLVQQASDIAGGAVARVLGGKVGEIVGNDGNGKQGPEKGSCIVFDGCGSAEAPQQTGLLASFIDRVVLQNDAWVTLDPAAVSWLGAKYAPFQGVDAVEIGKGCGLTAVTPAFTVAPTLVSSIAVEGLLHIQNGDLFVQEALVNRGNAIFDGYLALGYAHRSDANPQAHDALICENGTLLAKKGSLGRTFVYGNAKIESSEVSLFGKTTVKGNWTADNAILKVPAMGADDSVVPLVINGDAKGGTGILVYGEDGSEQRKPDLSQPYVAVKGNVDAAAFALINDDISTGAGGERLYLSPDGSLVPNAITWQVAAGVVLTFDLNDGAGPSLFWNAPAQRQEGDSYYFALPQRTAKRAGFLFKGWNAKADGTGKAFTEELPLPGSATVYAQWERVSEGKEPTGPTGPTGPADPNDPSGPKEPSGADTPSADRPVGPSAGGGASGTPSVPTAGGSAATSPTTSVSAPASSSAMSKKPSGTSIKKLKGMKRGFTVTWKKPSRAKRKNVTGYQVRYSPKKSLKGAKKKTVRASSKAGRKCTLKVSKLKGGKKYYVQVRTYRVVKMNGKKTTLYSAWSKTKAVKTRR